MYSSSQKPVPYPCTHVYTPQTNYCAYDSAIVLMEGVHPGIVTVRVIRGYS